MRANEQEHLRFVLGKLAERMVRAKAARTEEPGVLFVLGAGCSMQYGLPRFLELLRYSYEDLHLQSDTQDGTWDRDSLRDRLDPHWRTAKPRELRRLLDRYLSRITGDKCTGYLRLARLACKGYVTAIVNMNFDLLLQEALEKVTQEAPEKVAEEGAETVAKKDYFTASRTFRQTEKVATSAKVVVYSPHGSVREGLGVPILDLASSDLFESEDETKAANKLFRNNDIVFLGYSGADAKIAAALTPEDAPRDEQEVDTNNYNQIFVLNLTIPDPRLLRIVVARRSTDLIVTGDVAAFENVMEELERAVRNYEDLPEAVSDRVKPRAICGSTEAPRTRSEGPTERIIPSRHFTGTEMEALYKCRNLATYLRSTMSVAEGGRISIEDHATEIFEKSLDLARIAGVGLTTPEKYLLHCAAYLHDLGYLWAHSGGRRFRHSGWNLLTTHGEDTAKLLEQAFKWYPQKRIEILPEKYRGRSDLLIKTLLLLCQVHSQGPEAALPGDARPPLVSSPAAFAVEVDELSIPVRPSLLYALFSAAEELTQGHPFFPSPHPLELDLPKPHDHALFLEAPLEDPVLDLYLREKSQVIDFRFDRETVVACMLQPETRGGDAEKSEAVEKNSRNAFIFFAFLAQWAIAALNRAAKDEGGWGVVLKYSGVDEPEGVLGTALAPGSDITKAVWSALCEQLDNRLLRLERSARTNPLERVGLVPAVLDLLAIYTDPIYLRKDEQAIVNPDPNSGCIRRAKDILKTHSVSSSKHLIHQYMEIRYFLEPRRKPSIMERLFCKSFEDIYRPAWRFCADKWLYGIDAIVMARASLDLGSSRFRDEVTLGLRKLLEDKITWCWNDEDRLRSWRRTRDKDRWKHSERWAFGHDGCTVCTSRLLYVLASTRRLEPAEAQASPDARRREVDEATAAILRYFLRRDRKDPAWWGIEEGQRRAEAEGQGDSALHSADYLAWAVKAIAHVIAVDEEIQRITDGKASWLAKTCGIEPEEVTNLFQDLWELLGQAGKSELLSRRTEEPHSYILGHVASTYLYVFELEQGLRERLLPRGYDWSGRVGRLEKVVKSFLPRNPGQLSQFFVWPAEVLLAQVKEEEALDEQLVDKLEQCLKSRVWIKSGEGRGSWGYNIDNTQRIVSSLNTFWRLAFLKPRRFEPLIGRRSWKGLLES